MEATSSAQQARASRDDSPPPPSPELEREILARHRDPVKTVPWAKVKEELGL